MTRREFAIARENARVEFAARISSETGYDVDVDGDDYVVYEGVNEVYRSEVGQNVEKFCYNW